MAKENEEQAMRLYLNYLFLYLLMNQTVVLLQKFEKEAQKSVRGKTRKGDMGAMKEEGKEK